MKISCLTLLVLIPTGIYAQNNAATLAGAAQATTYHMVVSDADSRVWERMTYDHSPSGQVVTNVHRYTELATGLNHLVNGQWVESKEEIDILRDGTAAATNGQHQAYFPGDIYNGQIELVTPDGKQLYSRPVGLSYFDGTNSVLIAELTNSIGEVAGNNQVIYPNAFTDFGADIRYTYTKAGFEQDIILKEQPPSPASFGLNPDTTRLQVLTEFFDPPQPAVTTTVAATHAGRLTDQQLNFGVMQMMQGRAFLLGTNSSSAEVNKQWTLLDGRQFLVEEVPVAFVADELESLPQSAIQTSSSTTTRIVSKNLILPPQRLAKATTKPMLLAKAAVPSRGLVLDYVALHSSTNNFTFQGDTTYYISGTVSMTGTNTIEGGTVIKYTNSASAQIYAENVLNCKTAPYRPAIFTSMNDDSVGETITNSTGSPATTSVTYLHLGVNVSSGIKYMRFIYAGVGIQQGATSDPYTGIPILDCQFVKCASAMASSGYYNGSFQQSLYNVLISQCSVGVSNLTAIESYFDECGHMALYGENVTADQVTALLFTHGYTSFYGGTTELKNSILTAVTNQIQRPTGDEDLNDDDEWVLMPTNDSISMDHCTVATDGTGIYQTAGAGDYYLADDTYRNAGTTPSGLIYADLETKTTYPPYVYPPQTIAYNLSLLQYVSRDTSAASTPDLGYHYDPIDYAVGGLVVTNATVNINPGTVIGTFGTNSSSFGLSIGSGAQLICEGSATNLNRIVAFDTVQEEPGTNWYAPPFGISDGAGAGDAFDFRFTDWSVIGPHNISHLYVTSCNPFTLRDCQFHGGGLVSFLGPTINSTNCLFERVDVAIYNEYGYFPEWRNNLFYGGTFDMYPFGSYYHSIVQDNLFDHTTIVSNPYCTYGGYNAYVTNYNRLQPTNTNDVILTNSLVYQTGPLGNYYQPTSSPLINKGSVTADQVGLYHYTVTTNEVQETNSVVDIGYHYNALDATGQPVESDTISISFVGYANSSYPITMRPPLNNNYGDGFNGTFVITRSNADNYYPSNLVVYFTTTGTASNGMDYTLTNLLTGVAVTNFITILANEPSVEFEIDPITNALCISNLTAILTLVASNGDAVDPNDFTTNILVEANPYTYVEYLSPMNPGISYYAPSNGLIYILIDYQFYQLNTNGTYIWGNGDTPPGNEVINLATVKTNAAGFTNGAIYYASGSPGTIGWISPDGSTYSNVWVTLTNSTDVVRGLYVDQTGTFGNNLIAVTGDGGVWEITSSRVATRLALITNAPLQGVITLANNSTLWGPWAGKIVTGSGDMNNPIIYSVNSSGVVTSNSDLGIVAADFNLILTNQNLYFVGTESYLWKASTNLFVNDVGGLLISQPRADGCFGGCQPVTTFNHMFFVVHWNSGMGKFVASRSIAYPDYDVIAGDNETPIPMLWQATFAPLDLPPYIY